MEEKIEFYDALEGKVLLADKLLDGGASVQVIDISPRIIPKGYTSEYIMARGARCSFGQDLRGPDDTKRLVTYLWKNWHTSPTELAQITFRLVVPKFVAIHFIRHRTAHINELSQRYAEMKGENFYNPLECEFGVREGCKVNKQSSALISDPEKKKNIETLLEKANQLQKETHCIYHQLIEAGLCKEVARSYLPMSEYTTLYYQMDLNNLAKMLYLRCDAATQMETQKISLKMMELAEQFFPISIGILKERMEGVHLLSSEVEVLKGEKSIDSVASISEKKALKEKAEILGIKL